MPDLGQLLIEPFALPFMQRALAASLIVGVVCAVVGAFVVCWMSARAKLRPRGAEAAVANA